MNEKLDLVFRDVY